MCDVIKLSICIGCRQPSVIATAMLSDEDVQEKMPHTSGHGEYIAALLGVYP